MKPSPLHLLTAFALLILAGCFKPASKNIVPDSAPIVASFRASEATVTGDIEELDEAMSDAVTASEGTTAAPVVKAAAERTKKALVEIAAARKAADPAALEKHLAELHRCIDQLRVALNKALAEIESLKDAETLRFVRTLLWLGLGASLFSVASVAACFTSIPFISTTTGPRLAIIGGVLAGTCFALARLFSWVHAHPNLATGIAALLIGGIAVGLWFNHLNHRAANAATA